VSWVALLLASMLAAPSAAKGPRSGGGGELSLFADASIASALTLVGVGLRGGYFVRPSLEIGGELQSVVLLPSRGAGEPAPRDDAPGAAFRATPMLRWFPLRTEGFAAYLLGGVGPGVVGLRGGVLGQAVVAPGALVHLGGRVWLDLAFRFSLSFPGGKCRRAFPAQEAPGFCELQFGPQLGLVAAF